MNDPLYKNLLSGGDCAVYPQDLIPPCRLTSTPTLRKVLVMNIHNSGYKLIFANRTIFRQLIEGFVEEE